MAVKRINLMDAIKSSAEQVSRSRTAIIRRGIVSVAPDANGLTKVALGGGIVDALALKSSNLKVNDQVAVLADTDAYWIAGAIGVVIVPTTTAQQASSVSLSVAGTTSASRSVTFAQPYAAVPSVFCNLTSSPGPSASWLVRAINATPTGFTVFTFGPSATFDINADWTAIERTTPPS